MSEIPLVSVVTVVFNAVAVLERTINSIINQDYSQIQYIIIDGNSTDGTLEIIKNHSDIEKWITEPDSGVYNAMNKAIMMADGEWIIFMNSGDVFYDCHCVSKMVSYSLANVQSDVIYGDAYYRYDFGEALIRAEDNISISSFESGLPFCHQSSMVRREMLLRNPFNESYRIAADLHFFYESFKEGAIFTHIDYPISVYDTQGLSSKSSIKLFDEISRASEQNLKIKYKIVRLFVVAKSFLYSYVPKCIFKTYRKFKYLR